MTHRLALVAALVLVVAAAGVSIAAGEVSEQSLSGKTLEKATAVALEHAGGGTVTETETTGDGYSVEVRLDDGSRLEVELDESFDVVGQENDDDPDA